MATLVLLAGCGIESGKYKAYPANPYTDLNVVAVLPFINQTRETRLDLVEMANIMASELTKFEGFRVIRPIQFLAAAGGGNPGGAPASAEEAIRWGRGVKADAVLVAAITDYDPFEPPKVGISVQFFRVQGRSMSATDIDRIVQSASWRRGPLPMSREKAPNWIDAFETVYDAHEQRIRTELVAYSQAQMDTDSAFTREREFTAVQPRYLQFVANQVINRLFERNADE
ncbi:MAG TPA: hypothetical protein VEN81_11555 [Planctomycetota bacterium]|nr:hypothetical protein [Planctomycetota bacterium]